jgi:hypothetical protein
MTFDTREWVAVAIGGAAIAGLVASAPAARIVGPPMAKPVSLAPAGGRPADARPSYHLAMGHGALQLAMR